jgi:MarR family transcriptional regulator, transcriptional regulator for hemolysin
MGSSGTGHEPGAPGWRRVESTLMATARRIREVYDHHLEEWGVNLTQAGVLAYLAEFGPVSQTKIASHLGRGRAATGVTIDGLDDRGLVERQPDPEDRRVWLIHLTDRGRALIKPITQVDELLREELRSGMTRADRLVLVELLQRLQSNLEGVSPS